MGYHQDSVLTDATGVPASASVFKATPPTSANKLHLGDLGSFDFSSVRGGAETRTCVLHGATSLQLLTRSAYDDAVPMFAWEPWPEAISTRRRAC